MSRSNENKSYMRVDESWQARVCTRVFSTHHFISSELELVSTQTLSNSSSRLTRSTKLKLFEDNSCALKIRHIYLLLIYNPRFTTLYYLFALTIISPKDSKDQLLKKHTLCYRYRQIKTSYNVMIINHGDQVTHLCLYLNCFGTFFDKNTHQIMQGMRVIAWNILYETRWRINFPFPNRDPGIILS